MIANRRIVDLTRLLVPAKEPFKFDVHTYFVEQLLPQFHREQDDWYILQEWKLSSHVGTHVESPYHHLREGTNVAGLDLGTLMGDAVVLELKEGSFALQDCHQDVRTAGQLLVPRVVIKDGRVYE